MACNCGGCGGLSPCNQLGVSQNEVNTPNCTAQTGVNQSVCGQSAGQLCSCSNCGCQQSTQCVPTPYYLQSQGCQESHDRLLINQQWAMSAKALESFAIPACNPPSSVTITVPGLMQIMIGSYVQFVVGGVPIYLLVTAFDFASHRVTLQNDACRYNVLTPGTVIPSCSLFNIATIVPVPPNTLSASYPYLQNDWTVPNVGACTDPLVLTTTVGLSAGQVVSILGATYTVDTVYNSTDIKLCNDTGGGAAPTTLITAHDYAGNHIAPVVGLNTNVCSNPAVTQGALLVCKNGIQQPLDGAFAGQVPVIVDAATNEVQFQNLDVPTLACTAILPPCVAITAGTTSGTFTFKVDNSGAIFEISDVVQIIKDGHYYQFVVTAAPVSNPADIVTSLYAIDGVIGGAAPHDVSFGCENSGDMLCIAGCCDQLQHQIDTEVPTHLIPHYHGDRIIDLSFGSSVWDSTKLGTVGAPGGVDLYVVYTEEPMNVTTAPAYGDFASFSVPNYGLPGEQYLVKARGQVIGVSQGDVPYSVPDNQAVATLLHNVTLFLRPAAGGYVYGEVGSVTWHQREMICTQYVLAEENPPAHFLGQYDIATTELNHVLTPGAIGGGNPPAASLYPNYSDPDGIWENCVGVDSLAYFSAPIVAHRICQPGDVITPVVKYRCVTRGRAPQDGAIDEIDTLIPSLRYNECAMRLSVYFWVQVCRIV